MLAKPSKTQGIQIMRPSFLAAALVASTVSATPVSAETFSIVALGDVPYGAPTEVYPPFEALIARINSLTPDLVIHVGDTKSGGTECSDQMLQEQLNYLNTFSAPTLYTPGDNEWTDCHRKNAGGYDPIERLDHIRTTYFADPHSSFGTVPVAVDSMADRGYPENARFLHKGVMFATAHVVGSNNNFEPREISAIEEFMARDSANREWLTETFEAAREFGSKALVLAIHADMFEADFGPSWAPESWLRHSGFASFGQLLIAEAAAFEQPVLLIYGDSHVFRQSRPFPIGAPNLMALEVPGSKQMHAVEVSVDPDSPGAFAVTLVWNPALATS